MKKDPKQFRERYQRWKQGIQVYESGRPIQVDETVPQYEDGKDSHKLNLPKSIQEARERMYKGLAPRLNYTTDALKSLTNTMLYNEYDEEFKNSSDASYEFVYDNKNADAVDAIYGQYLNIPINKRFRKTYLNKSNYKPTIGNDNEEYYKLDLDRNTLNNIMLDGANLEFNKSILSRKLSHYNLGDHTLSRGFDNKGDYVSYYDRWDLNPFHGNQKIKDIPILNKIGDLTFGIGTPLNIYDRIYFDDYYGVSEPTRGVYLPPVYVDGVYKPRRRNTPLRRRKNNK